VLVGSAAWILPLPAAGATTGPARPGVTVDSAGSVGGGSASAGVPAAALPGATTVPRLPAAPADSLEAPGTTVRVSLDAAGAQLATASGGARISADGRFVVFRQSTPVRLPSGATQDLGRILLRDRVTGTTTVVAQGTVTAGIALAVAAVSEPAISADGRWVAYVVGNPGTTGARTIRLWDRTTGQSSSPGQLRGACDLPALSADGRFLAFRTDAALVPSDTNQLPDIYVLDRQASAFDLVSAGVSGGPGYRGQVGQPSISEDGSRVAFASTMIGLVSRQAPVGVMQIYLRDRSARTTTLVSAAADGSPGDHTSAEPSISGDGAMVAFSSTATAFAGPSSLQGIFVWSQGTGRAQVASVSTEGAAADGGSSQPSLSADGRYVAFSSGATNLVPGDANGIADIFVHDLVSGRTTRVSVGPGPVEAAAATAAQRAGGSFAPSVSSDGRYIAFESDATNLVPGDTNGVRDVFVRDRQPALSLSPSPLDFGTVGVGESVPPGTITIRSIGAGPLAVSGLAITGTSSAAFSVTADGCTGETLYPGDTCQLGITFAPTSPGAAAAVLQVSDSAPGAPHADVLTALVVRGGASITITPAVGPPGIVAIVTGAGFTPKQKVSLAWKPGITPVPLSAVFADAKGAFRAQVLVLPNDVLGPRSLFASSPGNVPGTPSAAAPFLVEPHTAGPPVGPVFREGPAGPGSLLFRH
jgi:Tol biopolymer transport system component